MSTWKEVWNKTTGTARTGGEAVINTAKVFKNTAVGTGKAAGGAAGGIAGFANWIAKAAANTGLKIVNTGFRLIRYFPRISAVVVTVAAATGVIAWWKRHKAEKSQEQEAVDLKASIEANKAARVETSAEMGQSGAFPLRTDWGPRMKGGLPGQQLPN